MLKVAPCMVVWSYGRTTKFSRLDGLLLFGTVMGLCLSSAMILPELIIAELAECSPITIRNSMIILLFCSPKSPACDSGGTELDIFDTQGTLQVGRLE